MQRVFELGWLVEPRQGTRAVVRRAAGSVDTLYMELADGAPEPTQEQLLVFSLTHRSLEGPAALFARAVGLKDLDVLLAWLSVLGPKRRLRLWKRIPETLARLARLRLPGFLPPSERRQEADMPTVATEAAVVALLHQEDGPAPDMAVSTQLLYATLSAQDRQLAGTWANGCIHQAAQTKMLSARCAERAARMVYERRGAAVRDVALSQLWDGDGWKLFDLEVARRGPSGPAITRVDVKNARRLRGSGALPGLCVPSFKRDRHGEDVILTGVLSPYHSAKDFDACRDGQVVVLGHTCRSTLRELERDFSTDALQVALIPTKKDAILPPWLFVEEGSRLPTVREADLHGVLPSVADLRREGRNPVPLLLASGLDLPAVWSELVPAWARPLMERLRGVRRLDRLYLTLLTEFFARVRDPGAEFEASVAEGMLFRDGGGDPLGLHDPGQTVRALLKAQSLLWTVRGDVAWSDYVRLEIVRGPYVRGWRVGARHGETVVSWCGGSGERGPCRRWPLVRDLQAACVHCGFLVCPDCSFCSEACPGA